MHAVRLGLSSRTSTFRLAARVSRAGRAFPKVGVTQPAVNSFREIRHVSMMAASRDADSAPRVAVVGGGIAGLTAASRLARQGCAVTVYETGRGPGGRTSTRRAGPDGQGWQFDHGAQFFSAKDPHFKTIVDEWVAEGIVGEWQGTFGVLDGNSKTFTEDTETKTRYVGTPSMNSVAKSLAKRTGVELVTSRRVVRFEKGADESDSWSVVHRSSAPPPVDADGNLTPEPPEADPHFTAIVVADKQTASDRSIRVYNEDPPIKSAEAPVIWNGMRAASQTPSFALMFAVKRINDKVSLFPFHGATVTNDKTLSWIAEDSSKPGRPLNENKSSGTVQCFVAQSTADFAKARVKAMSTIPGTSPHQTLLDEVAREMLEAVFRLAGMDKKSVEVVHVAAHRWGAAFPGDEAFASARESGGGCLSDFEKRIVGCGDFCVSPKIEGAALSGAAAAARVTEMIKGTPSASL